MLKLFSADDHIIEPPGVWQDRVPARYRDVAAPRRRRGRPRVLGVRGHPRRDDGPQRRRRQVPRRVQPRPDPLRRHAPWLLRPEPSGPRTCWPTGSTPASCSRRCPASPAPCSRSSRISTSPTCACAPTTTSSSRSGAPAAHPACSSPRSSPNCGTRVLGAAEIRRCAELGARALSFPENPVPLGLPSYWTDHWDPVWQACQDTDVVLCLHIGTSGEIPIPSPEAPDVRVVLDAPGRLDHVVGELDDEPGLPEVPGPQVRVLRRRHRLAPQRHRARRPHVAAPQDLQRTRRHPALGDLPPEHVPVHDRGTGLPEVPRRHRRRSHHVGVRLPAHRHDVARLPVDHRRSARSWPTSPTRKPTSSPTATPSGSSAGRWRIPQPSHPDATVS